MNIGMTGIAFGRSFGKFQRSMTILTGNSQMLPYQRKFGTVMIEGNSFPIHFPAIGFMAVVAIGSETVAMRRFLGYQA
jgi:hypothetical protein